MMNVAVDEVLGTEIAIAAAAVGQETLMDRLSHPGKS
jgi:hypothetical protein